MVIFLFAPYELLPSKFGSMRVAGIQFRGHLGRIIDFVIWLAILAYRGQRKFVNENIWVKFKSLRF